jgi:hypothetical protein
MHFLLLIFASLVQAEPATPTLWADWARVFGKTGAELTSAFGGPTLHRLDGDLDGRGHNLTWENDLDLTYKFAKDWRLKVGGGVIQYFRPVDPKNPNRRDTDIVDPSISIGRKRLIQSGPFTLEGKVRYFFPWSYATKATAGRVSDSARGMLNLGAYPVMKFFDGDFAISSFFDFYYRFDKSAAANRESYSLKSRANFSYLLARKLAGSLEYSTGNLRHNNAGHWQKLRDRQRVIAGLAYLPIETLSLAPTLAWGANKSFRLNRAEFGLEAVYEFL